MQWHDVTQKILGGHWGGQTKFWGGSGPPGTPLAPPLAASRKKQIWVFGKELAIDSHHVRDTACFHLRFTFCGKFFQSVSQQICLLFL